MAPLNGFSVNVGQSFAIRVLGANCASPAGLANVSVDVNGTPVTMAAASPDNGRYTGTFTPAAAGPLTVTATVTIGGNSDVQTVTGTATSNQNYVCQNITDPWIDATGGTVLPLHVDAGFTTVALPFSFTYYGQVHTQAFVSSNGFLVLGSSSGPAANFNGSIPSSALPNGVVAPFWDNLNPAAGGSIYSSVTGVAPNRALHLEWFDVPHAENVGGAATFEVSLYETTNEIRFRYLDTDFGNATLNAGRSATSGVENHSGTAGTQYSQNQAVLTNGKAISCSQGGRRRRHHHHRHHRRLRHRLRHRHRRHHRRHRRRRRRHLRPAASWRGGLRLGRSSR